ncbi:protein-tyrosine phosphatase [Chryseobacterium sp. 52]|uniref:phosphatase PAP2/dual specificity phosphatase family protein n=1 Tax=Chryseobacterium sp. 52 TaxID=2035213 RepID=UPI000C18B3FD|nr:phosphatase PAP2/dual specificity phosphatase family protein [Chryseobacterium sp. 52]PIF47445.1 protein-tyrosine phosphatase [Chryseobacterium sp. 52]
MDERRPTIKQQIYAFALCAFVFMIVYNFATWYTLRLEKVPSFVFDFEKYIPFLPWSIIPYMTSGIFFCLVFFLCTDREQLKVLTKRMLFSTVTAGLCFIIFPLRFSLIKPETEGSIFSSSFQFLKVFDSPFNQSPSLHIAFAFIFWTVFRDFKKFRSLSMLWLIVLGISTLTTYQHHFIDIISGIILAHISFMIFPYRNKDFRYRNFHMANFYFLFGWILILAALLLDKFSGHLWLIFLWPSAMSIIIGYQYQKNNIHFLKDKNGSISLARKIFYAPYLMMYQIFWKFLRKNKRPLEIVPRIYISSRPGREDLHNFEIGRNTFVYDLSAEIEEISELKKMSLYHSAPFLDIGTLDRNETKKLVKEITENYKKLPVDGKIFIHCTMGFTRSSVIGILVIKNILSLPVDEAADIMKGINRNAVIHPYLKDFLKKI